MLRLIVFCLLAIISIDCFSQSYWRVENERGEELLLTINVDPDNLTFETHTRKDALKDMAGSFMYMLAKTAGKIKYPELMHGEGKISFQSDTTFYTGNIDYPDKLFTLKAKTWHDNFFGLLTDNKNKTTVLIGKKLDSDKPLRDYPSLINLSFSMVETFYWDPNILKSSDWQNFKNEINDFKFKIADDYEMAMMMMWLGKKLTQIPHEIKKLSRKTTDLQQKKSSPLKIANDKKALLFLNQLPTNNEEMAQIFKEISEKNIEILILLAEGNRNLTLNSALLLANHLTAQPTIWGCYLTRKWQETKSTVPQPFTYEIVLKNPLTLSGFTNESFSEKGFFLKTAPVLPIFNGKVYLLINKSTSNVAEALAIYLKNEKLATLVGQQSAGSPELTNIFNLDKQYRITIPFAQFYDKNGRSYHGIGVEPDMPVEKDATGYVLKL